MMRDDYALDWRRFYRLVDESDALLRSAQWRGNYYVDVVVIDMFGRSSVLGDFANTKDVWEYDGPNGPGWGVRQWVSRDWYPDAEATLTLPVDTLFAGDTLYISTTISNNTANVYLDSVSVRIYADEGLIQESFVDLPANSSEVPVATSYVAEAGEYTISVRVDEDDLKLELDEDNNNASATVLFLPWSCGDANHDAVANITDAVYLITYIFGGGPAPVPAAAGDANCDELANITDAVYLIQYIFNGGPAPCEGCA